MDEKSRRAESLVRIGVDRSIAYAGCFAALALAALFAPGFASAQSLERFDDPESIDYRALRLPWSSTNRNPDGLSRELEELYLLLYNNDSLPIREYVNADGRTMSDLAYELGFVRGGYFPVGVDALLCDLNRDVCNRPLKSVDDETLWYPKKHVGGTYATEGNWTGSARATVRVVDLELEEEIKFVERNVPEGRSIIELLREEAPDCSAYRAECIEIVRKLNPYTESFDEPSDGHMTAVLPVLRVSVMLPIRTESLAWQLQGNYSLYVDQEEAASRELVFAGPQNGRADMAFEEIQEHVDQNLFKKRPMPPTLNSNFDNVLADTLSLYELTAHPFRNREGSVADLVGESVAVGVIDFWVDEEHCHFGDKVEAINGLAPRQLSRSADCYEIDSAASELDSHGTHVVGTITGGDDGDQVIGLYPQAEVFFAQVDPEKLGDPLESGPIERDIFILSQIKDVSVVNMSWEYIRIGDNDPVLQAIDAWVSNTLFVAAAGNSGRPMARGNSGCIWDPACQSSRRPNVISVVGLTASGHAPEVYKKDSPDGDGSNYGTAFDIAAIGQNVLSVVNGDKAGRMSGTSMAAPQVTAAAALVAANFKETRPAARSPSPAQIKNRLMYTSDIFPNLLGSVYSGRLNIERAISINEARVVLDGASNTPVRVKIVDEPEMLICRVSGADTNIPWRNVRRIATNELSNSLVVFYEEYAPSQPQNAKLNRITDCELRTQSTPISFMGIDDGQDIRAQLKDILDLTMRF